MSPSDNRRKYTRIAFLSPANLVLSNQSLAASLIDISLKGALIKLSAATELNPGAVGSLQVTLGDSGDEINGEITVAHSQADKVGLHWKNLDLDSVTHLHRLIEVNLGDHALLERELSALVGL